MLDLEKKMDKRFLEAHHETASAIVNALDVSSFKKDIDAQVQQITIDMDSKFDQVFSSRMNVAEEEIEKQLATIKDLIDTAANMQVKQKTLDSNLKDTVSLIKALDARFV